MNGATNVQHGEWHTNGAFGVELKRNCNVAAVVPTLSMLRCMNAQ